MCICTYSYLPLPGKFSAGASDNNHTCNFIELMSSNLCLPVISRPTGIDERSAILIDNVLTSNSINYNSGCSLSTISDHHPIFFMQKYVTLNLITNYKILKYRLINYYIIDKFENSLLNHKFDELLTDNNINVIITDFHKTLLHYYNLYCSIQSRTISLKTDEKLAKVLFVMETWENVKIRI